MLNAILELDSKDVKDMIKRLKAISPDLVSEYRKHLKEIANPIVKQIEENIPNEAPLSGMGFVISRISKRTRQQSYVINNGRLNWQGTGNYEKPLKLKNGAKTVTFSSAIKPNAQSATTPIAKVIIMSPAVAMTDMAGRGSSGNSSGRSRQYTYRKRNGEIVMRRHALNGQGINMINKLRERYGAPSRFGWKGLEQQIDNAAKEIDKILDRYLDKSFGGK